MCVCVCERERERERDGEYENLISSLLLEKKVGYICTERECVFVC